MIEPTELELELTAEIAKAAIENQNRKKKQPSKALKQSVREAFDSQALIDMCWMDDFSDYATRYDLQDGRNNRPRFYWYQDNGSNVLAVAHLDSVQDDPFCNVMETANGLLVASPVLDDRLGVYVILDLLPKLGIVCDYLLTTDEEMGASTAEEFTTRKQYNWIFQFDRMGTDVVMYQYETKEYKKLVEDVGARVGQGIFSDISVLDFLGCAGFNWGVGYQDYHSIRSHAWLEDTFRQVARFVKFYRANAATFLPHVEEEWESWNKRANGYTSYPGWESPEDVEETKNWWKRAELLQADCGHLIDLDDESSYVELKGGLAVCKKCAEDDFIPQAAS